MRDAGQPLGRWLTRGLLTCVLASTLACASLGRHGDRWVVEGGPVGMFTLHTVAWWLNQDGELRELLMELASDENAPPEVRALAMAGVPPVIAAGLVLDIVCLPITVPIGLWFDDEPEPAKPRGVPRTEAPPPRDEPVEPLGPGRPGRPGRGLADPPDPVAAFRSGQHDPDGGCPFLDP